MKTPEEMAEEYGASPHEKDAYLAGYQAAKPQWISVKERLPDNALEVIAISNGKSTAFLHKLAYCRWVIDETITHWMPLPEAPKGEG